MLNWSKYILFFGILIGFALGGAMVYVALQHNPQNEFTDHPEGLLQIFFVWAGAGSLPFSLIASLIEFYKCLKEKPWKAR